MSIPTTRRARGAMSDEAKARRSAVASARKEFLKDKAFAEFLASKGLAKPAKAPRTSKREVRARERMVARMTAKEKSMDDAIADVQASGGYYTPAMVKYLREMGESEEDIALFKAPRKARGAVPAYKRHIAYGLDADERKATHEARKAEKAKVLAGIKAEIDELKADYKRTRGMPIRMFDA